jgi:hypothetical protein
MTFFSKLDGVPHFFIGQRPLESKLLAVPQLPSYSELQEKKTAGQLPHTTAFFPVAGRMRSAGL